MQGLAGLLLGCPLHSVDLTQQAAAAAPQQAYISNKNFAAVIIICMMYRTLWRLAQVPYMKQMICLLLFTAFLLAAGCACCSFPH
jgi:hypothetical protein